MLFSSAMFCYERCTADVGMLKALLCTHVAAGALEQAGVGSQPLS
jgi:hypothetical protein